MIDLIQQDLTFFVLPTDGALKSPLAKILTNLEQLQLCQATNLHKDDVLILAGGDKAKVVSI